MGLFLEYCGSVSIVLMVCFSSIVGLCSIVGLFLQCCGSFCRIVSLFLQCCGSLSALLWVSLTSLVSLLVFFRSADCTDIDAELFHLTI